MAHTYIRRSAWQGESAGHVGGGVEDTELYKTVGQIDNTSQHKLTNIARLPPDMEEGISSDYTTGYRSGRTGVTTNGRRPSQYIRE